MSPGAGDHLDFAPAGPFDVGRPGASLDTGFQLVDSPRTLS